MALRKLGLIGYPLSHSFSKKYFTEKFDRESISGFQYDLYPISTIKEVDRLIASTPELIGLNVTIPYKELVIPFLDALDPTAAAIGAVNTIQIEPDGRRIGYNTDIFGFRSSLKELLDWNEEPFEEKALILGTGGAAKAVAYVLKHLEISYHFVSRKEKEGQYTYQKLRETDLKEFPLIINTTPLGMAPALDTYPDLEYDQLDERHFLYDLVYNPEKTLFLEKGERQGSRIMNGSPMLIGQAEAAWNIWTQAGR